MVELAASACNVRVSMPRRVCTAGSSTIAASSPIGPDTIRTRRGPMIGASLAASAASSPRRARKPQTRSATMATAIPASVNCRRLVIRGAWLGRDVGPRDCRRPDPCAKRRFERHTSNRVSRNCLRTNPAGASERETSQRDLGFSGFSALVCGLLAVELALSCQNKGVGCGETSPNALTGRDGGIDRHHDALLRQRRVRDLKAPTCVSFRDRAPIALRGDALKTGRYDPASDPLIPCEAGPDGDIRVLLCHRKSKIGFCPGILCQRRAKIVSLVEG